MQACSQVHGYRSSLAGAGPVAKMKGPSLKVRECVHASACVSCMRAYICACMRVCACTARVKNNMEDAVQICRCAYVHMRAHLCAHARARMCVAAKTPCAACVRAYCEPPTRTNMCVPRRCISSGTASRTNETIRLSTGSGSAATGSSRQAHERNA